MRRLQINESTFEHLLNSRSESYEELRDKIIWCLTISKHEKYIGEYYELMKISSLRDVTSFVPYKEQKDLEAKMFCFSYYFKNKNKEFPKTFREFYYEDFDLNEIVLKICDFAQTDPINKRDRLNEHLEKITKILIKLKTSNNIYYISGLTSKKYSDQIETCYTIERIDRNFDYYFKYKEGKKFPQLFIKLNNDEEININKFGKTLFTNLDEAIEKWQSVNNKHIAYSDRENLYPKMLEDYQQTAFVINMFEDDGPTLLN